MENAFYYKIPNILELFDRKDGWKSHKVCDNNNNNNNIIISIINYSSNNNICYMKNNMNNKKIIDTPLKHQCLDKQLRRSMKNLHSTVVVIIIIIK